MTHLTFRKGMIALLMCLLLILTATTALAGRADLTLSLESGFYLYPMPLEITCDVKGARIYYTTDGSIPDETDTLYEGVITLMFTTEKEDPLSQKTGIILGEAYVPQQDFPSAHVIRAVAIMPEGTRSEVVGGTYFIGYDREELYGDLPVVSLMMEADHLFDHETGIYVAGEYYENWVKEQTEPFESWEGQGNYTQRGKEWERPVYVDYMPAEGEGFKQEMGVRIKGAASRGNSQKSLRLIARDDYGEKNLKYELFPDNLKPNGKVLKKYKSFTLRNGGNDCDFGKIRDPYIQRLARGLRVETSANRPAIAFINGEFWGLYTLTEEYSDNYFDYHYGISNENVITIKNGGVQDGEDKDIDLYYEAMDYIIDNDMSDPACYARACEMVDVGSFIDYTALMLYIYNEDGIFQNNNWQMWRVREPGEDDSPYADGRWRMVVYDTDYSSGIYNDGTNFRTDNVTPSLFGDGGSDWAASGMVRSLMANEDFREQMILALCDMRNFYFAKPRASALLKEMTDAYLPYGGDTFRRFGPDWVARWDADRHFKNELQQIGAFFDGRYGAFIDIVEDAFDLAPSVTVVFKCDDWEKGAVYVNGRTVPIDRTTSTQYFTDAPITVTAVPAEGHKFVGWESTSAYIKIEDPTSPTTSIKFTRRFTLKAVFE